MIMWNWIKKIRTFFRFHDYETSGYFADFPLVSYVKCKKCGKEDVYFLHAIIGNPAAGFMFFHNCSGKTEPLTLSKLDGIKKALDFPAG